MKKILPYELQLVPNYSCLQNPWLGGYLPQIPDLSVLCPQMNLLTPPPHEKNSWVSHCLLSSNFVAASRIEERGLRHTPSIARFSTLTTSFVTYKAVVIPVTFYACSCSWNGWISVIMLQEIDATNGTIAISRQFENSCHDFPHVTLRNTAHPL